MTGYSLLSPARLLTAFGTVLYVDAASGELRHGAIGSVPANAVFVLDSNAPGPRRKGRLMLDSGSARAPIVCESDQCRTNPSANEKLNSVEGTQLEIVPLERGLLGLTANGRFLMADPNGCVSLAAQVCSTWELFLASEDWCADTSVTGVEKNGANVGNAVNVSIDLKKVRSYIVQPLIRTRANTQPKAAKVLIYGYTKWSHGRVYYDLCKQLHRRGYIVDILDWQVIHDDYIADLISYYDLFMTALDGVRTLVDRYRVPYDRIIAVSHHEFDIRMLIEQKGVDAFDKFANYGVVSEFLYCASQIAGVPRVPMVASLGVNYPEFFAEVADRLETVGYASSISAKTYGVEWKRGDLAEAAVRDAGLTFRVAGSTGNQTSFHDMPDFYKSVDAVVTSSISEAAQLPVMEAAAAGRLVIGTPVGHFPLKAYQGGGIIAPVAAGKFRKFVTDTLLYYKENSRAYVDKCHAIQEAARKFDWQYAIGDWIELIDSARFLANRTSGPAHLSVFPRRETLPAGTVVETMIDGQSIKFLVTNPHDAIMKDHYAGRFYELEELEIIKRHYSGSKTFLDIGANVGNHAIHISRFVRSSKIIVFEPNPVALEVLIENLRLNGCENVDTTFLGIALGAREGLLKGTTPDPNNLGHTRFYEDVSGDIQAVKGDSLVLDEPIEFIKIDVEGMEIEILSGLEQAIRRWRPAIFIEIWDERLQAFLDWCEREGYEVVERYQRYSGVQNYLARPVTDTELKAGIRKEGQEIRALLKAVSSNAQRDVATWICLGTCYRDAGRALEAAIVFERCAEIGGQGEEVWYARWQHARCLRQLGDDEGFVRSALAAFRERPHRAEPLKDLSDYYFAIKRPEAAAFYAESAMALPRPGHDTRCIDDSLYEVGLKHSFAVAANWSADQAQKERGRKVCDWLALSRDTPAHLRSVARYNSGWYATPAQYLLPSLQFRPLTITAPEGFHAANVAICRHGDAFAMTTRAVNYRLSNGYHDKGGDTSYRSRILLSFLDPELCLLETAEVSQPRDLPQQSHEALGFEDPRPFIWRKNLWCVSSVRQLNREARPEMVLARIDETRRERPVLTDWRVLASGMPPAWEKNWMPQIVNEELRLVYSVEPTRILTDAGVVVLNEPVEIAAETFRGGSQAVPFDGGWLMVIHEFEWVNSKRQYFHRFIWVDGGSHLRSLSRRFYMRHRGYEFVAGMAWHLDMELLVISFSVDDRDPFLAVVDANDVRAVLLAIDEHRRASERGVEAGRMNLERLRAGWTPNS